MTILSSILLFLMVNTIDATLPDLSDLTSIMPNLFTMVPINGRIRLNDQVFNIGPNETQLPTDQSLPKPPGNEALLTRQAPQIDAQPLNVETNNANLQARESQIPNFSSQTPNFQSQIPNFESRIPNFRSQIPNFESQIPNFDSRVPNFNSIPNPPSFQSTLMNVNRFNDQTPQPSLPTTTMNNVPFGIPMPSGGRNVGPSLIRPIPMRARSAINPSEVSLVTSPDRLVQTEDSPLNLPPVTVPSQMPQMSQIPQQVPQMSQIPQQVPQILLQVPQIPLQVLQIRPQAPPMNELERMQQSVQFEPLPIAVSEPIIDRTQQSPSTPQNPSNLDVEFPQPIAISGPISDRRGQSPPNLSNLPSLNEESPVSPLNDPNLSERSSDGPLNVPNFNEESSGSPPNMPSFSEGPMDNPQNTPSLNEEAAISPLDNPNLSERSSDTLSVPNFNEESLDSQSNQPNLNEESPDSLQVTRETSFVFPPATINKISTDPEVEDPTVRSTLEQHLPPVTAPQQNFTSVFNTSSKQFENSVIPIRFMSSLFRPQRIPTLDELDKLKKEESPSLAPMN